LLEWRKDTATPKPLRKKRLNPRNRDKAHKQRRKPVTDRVADRNLLRNRTRIPTQKLPFTGKRPGSGARERR